ncbi:phosphogluconate dehydratase [Arenimonas sp.]|jgi:phosphogluconate dehydratase|uniref:phosphogluconate dehydratase n=1 Tax=Arenimonas sp. TaxID=1872635 RepID=UPI0037C12DB1
MSIHPVIAQVTARIEQRSRELRADYTARMQAQKRSTPARRRLSCSNLAHVMAASGDDKPALGFGGYPNIGIVTAYNDMLSAHQPYESYPPKIRDWARACKATAQVAGGVPAMCDGVTQGQPGMELSLFSRDVIALATAVAFSHDAFDAGLMLGVCDKIVPGLFMGAAAFGHLPIVFVPAGPMPSGVANAEKAKVRQRYADGLASREELLAVEAGSYHAPGTCTFYGTANSNQLLMEMMGLHIPGSAFVPPSTGLREVLTEYAVQTAAAHSALGEAYLPFHEVIDARSLVNGVVGLMATGGSTNLMIHILAMARAVGYVMTLDDLSEISAATPLLARIYPNGAADVNQFHAAGGMAFVIRELLSAGLLHADARSVIGQPISAYAQEPVLSHGHLHWQDPPAQSGDDSILRPAANPFSAQGGLCKLVGNLGQAVIKISALDESKWTVTAPARVFDSQTAMARAHKAGELTGDLVAVVRYQGARANGMPELHQLMPLLANLQDKGHKVALVTDGRLSGASGKVPAAIHLSPSADDGGLIAKIRDGDMIRIDAVTGELQLLVDSDELDKRPAVACTESGHQHGLGREYFQLFRDHVSSTGTGASILFGEKP